MDRGRDIFEEFEDMLDEFINRIGSIKKYIKDVGYDIDKVKKSFMEFIRERDEIEIFRYKFIFSGLEYNPLCDILKMMRNESDDEIDRIIDIIVNFDKYTKDIVREEYNSREHATDPFIIRVLDEFGSSYDGRVSYRRLPEDLKWYLELKCRVALLDVITFKTICKYKSLFEKVIFPMCAKCSYDNFKHNPW